jgi:hypothetical protein
MTNATLTPNPVSTDFFSDLADQMISRLDINACLRVSQIVQQIENTLRLLKEEKEKKAEKGEEILACEQEIDDITRLRLATERYRSALECYENPKRFIKTRITLPRERSSELIHTLKKHRRSLDLREGKEKARQALFAALTAWARLQVAENQHKLEELKKEPEKNSAKISECEKGIKALEDLIRELDSWDNNWSDLRDKLTSEFEKCLGLAFKIWKGMEWPLPFGLVLYEEFTELDGLRTKRREEAHKCLDALLSRHDEEAREARKRLYDRLSQFLADDAKSGKADNDAKAQARKDAVQALENCIKNPQDDTKRALDAVKNVLIEMALEHSFKKVQLNGDGPLNAAGKGGLVGIALSGGGIRSATFNLGVLQGLAHSSLLPFFDYLSTVSGGGYIGSWLLAWLKRKGLGNVSKQLRPDWKDHPGKEPPEIEFLRSYSNYLTPQRGLLSADTWSLVATWVRNFLLNLTILVLVISVLLLLPRLVVRLSHNGHPLIYLVLAVVFMLTALSFTGANLNLFSCRHKEYPRYSQQAPIQWRIVIPTVLASWLASCWLWNHGQYPYSNWWPWWLWGFEGLVITYTVWLVAFLLSLRTESNPTSDDGERAKKLKNPPWLGLATTAPLVGALGGLLFYWLAKLYAYLSCPKYPGREIHFVTCSVGLVAAIFGLMVVLQIGVMGKRFPDERREWWSRVGAWVTIYALGWTALFALALYAPLVVRWTFDWVKGAVTLAWLAHTIYGALGARSAKTGGSGPNNGTGILLKAAPFVFVIGLLALLSFSIYLVLPHVKSSAPQETMTVKVNLDLSQGSMGKPSITSVSVNSAPVKGRPSYYDLAVAYWPSVTGGLSGRRIVELLFLCFGLALALSWRVDINEFSMHLLYRNRVVRCYLGASHQGERLERNPNPFTGFDPDDDILLAKFAQGRPLKDGEREYVGPYPILNATLNVTHGKRLAWQERKAESFVLTPCYCGFDVKADWQPRVKRKEKPLERAGYRPTGDYLYSEKSCPGGPYLGTAVGISGAAISPNMGYHSDSALAFLMTVFDVRLGWWAGNPRHQGGWWTRGSRNKLSWRKAAPPWKRRGPGFGILYLLLELFGLSDDERGYVYLSDGGHFENLGVYELVRRGCRLILVCDASEDPDYKFEGLGNAIRKCRIDLGTDIQILDLEKVRAKANKNDDTKWSQEHCALGIIHYEKLDASRKPGILVYLKASLTGDEPADVLDYKSQHPEFPHDAMADQFFTESQFESYRKLGEHVIGECLKKNALELEAGKTPQWAKVLSVIQEPELWMDRSAKDLEDGLKSAVQPPEPTGAEAKPGSAKQPARKARGAAGESSAPVSS